ncbi:hypothetical protein BT63DRAFT_454218 [Microthyrium microscopicum]|uniref:Uncharacterized protein n=1 Tax=Microthyrium microscopicum TaxID=703497 RepID=A0A6A6UF16_9PEZI|nr:hypothetical protein BT63DRAFT_454218 [Microthyrium microscopicum]
MEQFPNNKDGEQEPGNYWLSGRPDPLSPYVQRDSRGTPLRSIQFLATDQIKSNNNPFGFLELTPPVVLEPFDCEKPSWQPREAVQHSQPTVSDEPAQTSEAESDDSVIYISAFRAQAAAQEREEAKHFPPRHRRGPGKFNSVAGAEETRQMFRDNAAADKARKQLLQPASSHQQQTRITPISDSPHTVKGECHKCHHHERCLRGTPLQCVDCRTIPPISDTIWEQQKSDQRAAQTYFSPESIARILNHQNPSSKDHPPTPDLKAINPLTTEALTKPNRQPNAPGLTDELLHRELHREPDFSQVNVDTFKDFTDSSDESSSDEGPLVGISARGSMTAHRKVGDKHGGRRTHPNKSTKTAFPAAKEHPLKPDMGNKDPGAVATASASKEQPVGDSTASSSKAKVVWTEAPPKTAAAKDSKKAVKKPASLKSVDLKSDASEDAEWHIVDGDDLDGIAQHKEAPKKKGTVTGWAKKKLFG